MSHIQASARQNERFLTAFVKSGMGEQQRKTISCELPFLCITKGTKTCGASQVSGHWEPQQETKIEEDEICTCLDCEGIKAPGSFVGRNKLELSLWYCTVNKLHYRTRHLSLCCETRAELVRKPVLTMCEWSVERSRHLSVYWSCPLWRGFGPSSDSIWS